MASSTRSVDACRIVVTSEHPSGRPDECGEEVFPAEVLRFLKAVMSGEAAADHLAEGETLVGWVLANPGWGLLSPASVLQAYGDTLAVASTCDDDAWRYFANLDLVKSVSPKDAELRVDYLKGGHDGGGGKSPTSMDVVSFDEVFLLQH